MTFVGDGPTFAALQLCREPQHPVHFGRFPSAVVDITTPLSPIPDGGARAPGHLGSWVRMVRGSIVGRFADSQKREPVDTSSAPPLSSDREFALGLPIEAQLFCKSCWPSNERAGKYGIEEV